MTRGQKQRPKTGANKPGQRRQKQLSEAYLERAALFHLQRFSASKAHLGDILRRRAAKRSLPKGVTPEEAADWIPAVLDKLERLGLLDDAAYAAQRARSQFLRGRPERVIYQDLKAKGVPEDLIGPALTTLQAEEGLDGREEVDLAAAQAYARRRRLGPWRVSTREADPQAQYRKDLAALARAGFSYEIARRTLESGDDD